ncbi:HPr family phosphocarrier protein [Halobacillus sp. Marseille-Q1614]|uniref:HPr family phosphocarrier protein n=1 Tax=Halobacillus sp. Marseille-Q1614 TaxID=2709134 RepID=UPI00156E7C1A|nr:HPr family phosphocarrier protein [Halobacillus sp. Marseille-Q1614]
MKEQLLTIDLNTGLQARPAAQFVQLANRFNADVFIEKDNKRINAKSIMGLMSLAIGHGEEVTLIADGNDEQTAIDELTKFVKKP